MMPAPMTPIPRLMMSPYLSDGAQHVAVPRRGRVEMLAALDARELDGAQLILADEPPEILIPHSSTRLQRCCATSQRARTLRSSSQHTTSRSSIALTARAPSVMECCDEWRHLRTSPRRISRTRPSASPRPTRRRRRSSVAKESRAPSKVQWGRWPVFRSRWSAARARTTSSSTSTHWH